MVDRALASTENPIVMKPPPMRTGPNKQTVSKEVVMGTNLHKNTNTNTNMRTGPKKLKKL